MRVIPRFALLIAASLLLNTNAGAQSDAIDAETYRNQSDRLHAIERRPHALETLSQAEDAEVLQEALDASPLMKEMAKALCLSQDGRYEEALAVIAQTVSGGNVTFSIPNVTENPIIIKFN